MAKGLDVVDDERLHRRGFEQEERFGGVGLVGQLRIVNYSTDHGAADNKGPNCGVSLAARLICIKRVQCIYITSKPTVHESNIIFKCPYYRTCLPRSCNFSSAESLSVLCLMYLHPGPLSQKSRVSGWYKQNLSLHHMCRRGSCLLCKATKLHAEVTAEAKRNKSGLHGSLKLQTSHKKRKNAHKTRTSFFKTHSKHKKKKHSARARRRSKELFSKSGHRIELQTVGHPHLIIEDWLSQLHLRRSAQAWLKLPGEHPSTTC